MPSIRYIPAPPSPVRRKPRGVEMTIHAPNPFTHRACGREALLYADGTIWCEKCGHAVSSDDCIDRRRVGRGMPSTPVKWTTIVIK